MTEPGREVNPRRQGLVLAALAVVLVTLFGAGNPSAAVAQARVGAHTSEAQFVEPLGSIAAGSRVGAASPRTTPRWPPVLPPKTGSRTRPGPALGHGYGAAPIYDTSVRFVDVRTVVRVEVGRYATAVSLGSQSGALSDGSVLFSGFVVAAKAEAGVVRHYTTKEAAESISKEGVLRPGSSGKTWLTTDRYASGTEARSGLALNKTPDGYFEVPMCRVQCPSGPSKVEPLYKQPGGGTQITTEFPINVGGLSFNPFGGS